MSASIEEIYDKILEKGLSEEELEQVIEKKAKEYGGFMTKKGILYIIAKEYGIDVQAPEDDQEYTKAFQQEVDYDEFKISIAEVKEGMQTIVLVGKITKLYDPREFSRKDGSIGVVASCYIGDETGEIKIVAWNDKALALKSNAIQQGQIVRIIGDYAKRGRDEKLEVNVGKKGKIILAPTDLNGESKKHLEQVDIASAPKSFSQEQKEQRIISKNSMSIDTLVNTYSFIKTIQGQVHIDEFKEVTKKDGDKIFLLKLNLSDESGSVMVTIWGDTAVETAKLLEDGVHIRLKNVSCKMNTYTNQKELSFTRSSTMQVL